MYTYWRLSWIVPSWKMHYEILGSWPHATLLII